MSMQLDLTFEVIPFADWRAGIAPLWNMEGRESRIAKAINHLATHRPWRGSEKDCTARVDSVMTAAGIPGPANDDSPITTPSRLATRLGGEFRPGAITDLTSVLKRDVPHEIIIAEIISAVMPRLEEIGALSAGARMP